MLSVAQQFLQEGSESSNERFIFITKVNYRPGVWVKTKRQICPSKDISAALLLHLWRPGETARKEQHWIPSPTSELTMTYL